MVGAALRRVNERFGARALVWAAVLAALAGVLAFVPLFDVLGYDFAFALGLVTAIAAVDVGHGAAMCAKRASSAQPVLRVVGRATLGALALLVLPLLVGLANALRVRNCNLAAGFAFFALLPASTALVAAPAGALAGRLPWRRTRLLAWLIPIGSVVWSLLRLYVDPPVFVLDPFGGYFPGPIYDEALRPPARLLAFRGVNLLWVAGAVAAVAALEARRRWVATLAAVLLVAGVAAFALRGTFGFHVQRRDLAAVLSRTERTAHFVVFSDPNDGTTEKDRSLRRDDLEFRYAQLTRILGVEPRGTITVWVFPDVETKKRLVGAANTLYAKPWTREVFLQNDRYPAPRLRHELAHVFAAAFGDPLFGVALRLWPWPRLASGLVEGVAEAADYGDPEGRSTVHQEAKAIVADGRAPPLAAVVGAGFSTLSGARAYTIAGSFTHFLLKRGGADRLRALYRSAGDFQGVYGTSLEALEREWRTFLDGQPDDADERAAARERYRKPAIFQRVCARELAARVAEARSLLGSEPERAARLLEEVCGDDPTEPTYRLELATARAAAGDAASARAIVETMAADEALTRPLRTKAADLLAELAFAAGDWAATKRAVERTIELATAESTRRTAFARTRSLTDETSRETLGRALFGDGPGKAIDGGLTVYLIQRFAAAFPDEALGHYLLGRQLATRDGKLALAELGQACPAGGEAPEVPLAPPFEKECRRLEGELALREGDLARADRAHEHLRATASTEAERLRAEDLLERSRWLAGRRAPPSP